MIRLLPATLLACAGGPQPGHATDDASEVERSTDEPPSADSSGGDSGASPACAAGAAAACRPGDDGVKAVPPGVALLGPTFTLTPQSGDGACASDFKFNNIALYGTPSADWCQIQQAVNAVKAAGTGGTIELVNTGQPFRLTGPIMLNADDITVVGLPDAAGEKPEIDFEPPPCTYQNEGVRGSCVEHNELNYSAFTVNDQTPGCAHPLDPVYCPRERVSLKNLTIKVRRGLAGPPMGANQPPQPTIPSQSVIMLMNCGDCEIEDTDLVPAYLPGARGVSQDGITFGPGTTGRLRSTGPAKLTITDIAKAGLYLTSWSGIHRDGSGALDDSGVTVEHVRVSACGGPASWGSGISVSGHGGAVSDCTVADNHSFGVLVGPQPIGSPTDPSDWVPVESTRITDCDIRDNAMTGLSISSTASAYGIDFVPEDVILTRVDAHGHAPFDGVRIEGGRHVTIDGGTFEGNNAGITLANQTQIAGMTSDITISGVTTHTNNHCGLFFIGVHDVSVEGTLLHDPAASASPAAGKGICLWGSHFDNSAITLDDLNIGERGMAFAHDGEAISGLYSLIGKAGPSNPTGDPNDYAAGVGLPAPQGSTYVDSTHGVTYWKSTGAADPKGWVTSGP